MTVTTAINALPTPQTSDDQDLVAQYLALGTQADTRVVSRYNTESARDVANPSPTAGQVVHTALENILYVRKATGGWTNIEAGQTKVKLVAESLASSIVLQPDNELFFYAEANSRYLVECRVNYECLLGISFKAQWVFPTGSTAGAGSGKAMWIAQPNGFAAGNTEITSLGFDPETSATMGSYGVGTIDMAYWTFILDTGPTPGNVTLYWAQATSSTTAMTLRAGCSYIVNTKLS